MSNIYNAVRSENSNIGFMPSCKIASWMFYFLPLDDIMLLVLTRHQRSKTFNCTALRKVARVRKTSWKTKLSVVSQVK